MESTQGWLVSAQTTALGDRNGPARCRLGEEAIAPEPSCDKLKIPRTFSIADHFAGKGGVSAYGDKQAHIPLPPFRSITNLTVLRL